MIRRFLTILITVAILGAAANDLWRYATTQSHIRKVTYSLAVWASENASLLERDQTAAQLLVDAQKQNVVVYAYDQTSEGVAILTKEELVGDVVVGTVINLMEGKSFQEAISSPAYVYDVRKAGFSR